MESFLLIIDVQKGMLNEECSWVASKVEAIQKDYDHVLISKFVNHQHSPAHYFLQWDEMMPGDDGIELAFKPRNDAIVFEKSSYSCVTSLLLTFLHQKSCSELDLCGVDTDACVLKTAFDLFDIGIKPNVLQHYCASRSGKQAHQDAIGIVKRNLGLWCLIPREEDSPCS